MNSEKNSLEIKFLVYREVARMRVEGFYNAPFMEQAVNEFIQHFLSEFSKDESNIIDAAGIEININVLKEWVYSAMNGGGNSIAILSNYELGSKINYRINEFFEWISRANIKFDYCEKVPPGEIWVIKQIKDMSQFTFDLFGNNKGVLRIDESKVPKLLRKIKNVSA